MNVRMNEQTIKRIHTRRQRQWVRNVCVCVREGRWKEEEGSLAAATVVWVYAAICYVVLTALLVFFHFRLLCLFFSLLHTRRIGFSFKRKIHKTNERFVNNKIALLFDESGIQRVRMFVCVFRMRDQSEKKRAFYAVNWNTHADINKNGKSHGTSTANKMLHNRSLWYVMNVWA